MIYQTLQRFESNKKNNDKIASIKFIKEKYDVSLTDANKIYRSLYDSDLIKDNTVVTCPYCHSINTSKISSTSKAVNTVLFGILGTKRHKQWHCNNCNSNF